MFDDMVEALFTQPEARRASDYDNRPTSPLAESLGKTDQVFFEAIRRLTQKFPLIGLPMVKVAIQKAGNNHHVVLKLVVVPRKSFGREELLPRFRNGVCSCRGEKVEGGAAIS